MYNNPGKNELYCIDSFVMSAKKKICEVGSALGPLECDLYYIPQLGKSETVICCHRKQQYYHLFQKDSNWSDFPNFCFL